MDFDDVNEELVDQLVKVEPRLRWLEGYFEGLDEDHEAAEKHVEKALNAIDRGENR